MAKCPKCGNTSFQYEEITPSGANESFTAVVCSNCNIVLGVLPNFTQSANNKKLLEDFETTLKQHLRNT